MPHFQFKPQNIFLSYICLDLRKLCTLVSLTNLLFSLEATNLRKRNVDGISSAGTVLDFNLSVFFMFYIDSVKQSCPFGVFFLYRTKNDFALYPLWTIVLVYVALWCNCLFSSDLDHSLVTFHYTFLNFCWVKRQINNMFWFTLESYTL